MKENLESCLDTAGMPPVDVMIRTSEIRLSNYLLWQNAYAKCFYQTYYQILMNQELMDILSERTKRERRFGGI